MSIQLACPCCNAKDDRIIFMEDRDVYDGWCELHCLDCKARIGRWSGRILKEGENETREDRYNYLRNVRCTSGTYDIDRYYPSRYLGMQRIPNPSNND